MMSRPKRVRKESGLREKEKEFTLTLYDQEKKYKITFNKKNLIAKPSLVKTSKTFQFLNIFVFMEAFIMRLDEWDNTCLIGALYKYDASISFFFIFGLASIGTIGKG